MLLLLLMNTEAFHPIIVPRSLHARTNHISSTNLGVRTRKFDRNDERRQDKKEKRDLRKLLEDDDEDDELAQARKQQTTTTEPPEPDDDDDDEEEETPKNVGMMDPYEEYEEDPREAMLRRMEERPDISTRVIDEVTGFPVIRQGKKVMDVIHRRAIKMEKDPDLRLEQMFPTLDKEIYDKNRLHWPTTTGPDMIAKLRAVSEIDGKLPVQPNVSKKAIDFVMANREVLGWRMKLTITRLSMKCAYEGKLDEMRSYQALGTHFRIIDDYISAPFRQMIMNAEIKVGPNFGNLNVAAYSGTELVDRAATYVVLKGMQCHWEKRLRDAQYLEDNSKMVTRETQRMIDMLGDPRRHGDDDAIWTVKDCSRICVVAQNMVKAFVESPDLYDDLPYELRFLEDALSIKGGVALRKYIIDEFCPKNKITPSDLRQAVGRLVEQFFCMYPDPYLDSYFVVEKLFRAMQRTTEDEHDPYAPYSEYKKGSPGYFQTYTFNCIKGSLQFSMASDRFDLPQENFDDEPEALQDVVSKIRDDPGPEFRKYWRNFKKDFGFEPDRRGSSIIPYMEDDLAKFVPPPELAIGREHNLTWWYDLNPAALNRTGCMLFGELPPGEIIYE